MGDKSKKHHYVPQAFLKAWADKSNKVIWCKLDDNKLSKVRINTIFHQNKLYSLANSIENDFITPFIDGWYLTSFRKLLAIGWCNLNHKEKTEVIRYLVSLKARNPETLESLKDNNIDLYLTDFLYSLKNSSYLGTDLLESLKKGMVNGNLYFLGCVIHELGLTEKDFDNMKPSLHKDIFRMFVNWLAFAKNKEIYFPSFSELIINNLDNLNVIEFRSEKGELITSNNPIVIRGISPLDLQYGFTLIANLSPYNAILIVPNNELYRLYKECIADPHSQEILTKFFNDSIQNQSSQIIKNNFIKV